MVEYKKETPQVKYEKNFTGMNGTVQRTLWRKGMSTGEGITILQGWAVELQYPRKLREGDGGSLDEPVGETASASGENSL